jgi:hypothetical protein
MDEGNKGYIERAVIAIESIAKDYKDAMVAQKKAAEEMNAMAAKQNNPAMMVESVMGLINNKLDLSKIRGNQNGK